jgi:hypothetical protein
LFIVACAEAIVIGVFQSLPIDHVTTCEPSEQTVVPDKIAECADAGADSTTTPAMMTAATNPIRPAPLRAIPTIRFTRSPSHPITRLAEHNEAHDA